MKRAVGGGAFAPESDTARFEHVRDGHQDFVFVVADGRHGFDEVKQADEEGRLRVKPAGLADIF